jgi:hypothetical protein
MGLRFEQFIHLTPDGAGTNLYSIDLGAAY